MTSTDDLAEAIRDAERYRWLRARDLDTIYAGGLFVGMTPENYVLNGVDLDLAVDLAMEKEATLVLGLAPEDSEETSHDDYGGCGMSDPVSNVVDLRSRESCDAIIARMSARCAEIAAGQTGRETTPTPAPSAPMPAPQQDPEPAATEPTPEPEKEPVAATASPRLSWWQRLWHRPTEQEQERARIRRTLMACSIEAATGKIRRDQRGGYY